MTERSRLLRLLMLVQSASIDGGRRYSDEALHSAGFVTERRPPDPFLGRRILAWIEEREQRRRRRVSHPVSHHPADVADYSGPGRSAGGTE